MKRSIFYKLIGINFLLILFLSSLILIISFNTIKNHYIATLASELEDIAYSLSYKILPLFDESNSGKMDLLVKEIGRSIKPRITIIEIDGRVLADSKKDPFSMENHRDRPEVRVALNGGIGKSLRFSATVQENMLYVAVPAVKEGKIVGVIRVSLFVKDIDALLRNLRGKILKITGIIVAIFLVLSIFFSIRVSKDIKTLVKASERMAKGDFNTKIFLNRKDEFGKLALSFNKMAEELKGLFDTLDTKQKELEGIISSLKEGLLVIDKEGEIILSNKSFENVIGKEEIKGKYYWEVIPSSELIELLRKVLKNKNKKNVRGEIAIGKNIFLCSISSIHAREEWVTVLHDITELRKLETVRKDFVANVSHELRTPLTAIKGGVETLEDQIPGEAKEYLDIIKKHTERIINIVEDLLTLAELEEKDLSSEFKKVNVIDVARNVYKIYKQKAGEKGIDLKFQATDSPIEITGDGFKLEQMFINLVDNAIKYTEKGYVIISIEKINRKVKITVEDSGIGIPKKHLDRIFERFYVVDKSRSRKLGGTGLGLSIVKHVVNLHNGEINVESLPEKGTKFVVFLPSA
ncbi:MAG: HAMP domain-containing protein [Candidatus Marinimicrobia bacterium]|nr:HAMP domain-containing protein [Candidatus Neomarinimicrobiota bacterium]